MSKLPSETVAGYSVLSQLPGFVAGLVSSAIIAVPLYFKQKREAAESERRIILAVQQQQLQEGGLVPTIASTMSALEGRQEMLLERFSDLRSQFDRVVRNAAYDRALPLARPYTAVARALATENAAKRVGGPTDDLTLSIDKLRELHSELFPAGFELAGQLRNAEVWLGTAGSDRADATYVPPKPEEVPGKLQILLDDWNRHLPSLVNATEADRLRAIATFHHRLVSIHPFLDGNGILARLVSGLQLRSLLGTAPALLERDAEYISALQAADAGSIEPLVAYFGRAGVRRPAV